MLQKSQEKKLIKGIVFNHKPLALWWNSRSCEEVWCILLLFILLHFTSLCMVHKSLTQHTCTKMDQFSSPISSVYLLFPIHHTFLTSTHSNIFNFENLKSLKSFEYIHIIRWRVTEVKFFVLTNHQIIYLVKNKSTRWHAKLLL